MAFITRSLNDKEHKLYNIPVGMCAVDEDCDAILFSRGGGGRNESPYDSCEFHWKGQIVTFRAPISSGKNQEGKKIVHWEIKHLNIPIGLRGQEQELKQLMKEAIIAYGQNGHKNPEFKYDVLVIDDLEDKRFTYISR